MSGPQDRFDSLAAALAARFGEGGPGSAEPVRLLIDTDAEIGRHEGTPEQRVGVTPAQIERLLLTCGRLGLPLEVAVIEGAGERAGFPDEAYHDAGAVVLGIDQVAAGGFLPDVVHALKEPAPHEARFPGPYTRIGAAHIEVSPPGLLAMIEARNVGIVVGGRTLGGFVNQRFGGDGFPVVASMSRFAGRVSGEQVRDLVGAKGVAVQDQRCLVVGAGAAGVAAACVILDGQAAAGGGTGEVLLADISEGQLERAVDEIGRRHGSGTVRLRTMLIPRGRRMTAGEFGDDAPFHGVVLAAAGRNRAPLILDLDAVDASLVTAGGAVADIGIDQGGCIAFDRDWAEPKEKIDAFTEALGARGIAYFGEVNMPRSYPHEASGTHGDAILPYLLALTALHAEEGRTAKVASRLLGLPEFAGDPRTADVVDLYEHDLRAGIQLHTDPASGEITVPQVHRGAWYAEGNGIFDAAAAANDALAAGELS